MSNQRSISSNNRNTRPAGEMEHAGMGATALPLLFNPNIHHDESNPSPPLAIARAGGQAPTTVTLPSLEGAGSGFEEGRRSTPVDIVGGSPRSVRESLTSYLFPFSQHNNPVNIHSDHHGIIGPLTPPSSFTANVSINPPPRPSMLQSHALPLTPNSSNAGSESRPVSTSPDCGDCAEAIPLISSLFPFHASQLVGSSHILEIVTPPDHVLTGFISDHPSGRTVFVHLPPPHVSSIRPESLSGQFSDVLRPHDPTRSPQRELSSPLDGLDIRESLTALLDLASEPLGAKMLVLALDKNDRGREGLNELLHSLMYVGGQVLPPGKGALDGGWEWDPRKWVLVGVEL